MVYESDFYTIRRSRPHVSSYTGGPLGPSSWHVTPSVRTSVLLHELDRIYHKPRPHLGCMALEDYLNSRPLVEFDDETKQIRADADRLRRRIHLPLPKHTSSLSLPFTSYYSSHPVPERPYHPMVDDILTMSYYSEPSYRTIGRGHLACMTFAGGKGYPRRRTHYSDENRDIGGEIKARSYYGSKGYVDAMSLPTGYASYLLRLKPPENNEKLTNLDKMHIIALAEERKKNARKENVEGDLIAHKRKFPDPDAFSRSETETPKTIKRQFSKPTEESTKTKVIEKEEEIQPESIGRRSSLPRRSSLLNSTEPSVVSGEIPEEPVKELPEPVIEQPEPPKPEKKLKKKSSLSRTLSKETPKTPVEEEKPVPETPKPLVEEVKPEPEKTTPVSEENQELNAPNTAPDEQILESDLSQRATENKKSELETPKTASEEEPLEQEPLKEEEKPEPETPVKEEKPEPEIPAAVPEEEKPVADSQAEEEKLSGETPKPVANEDTPLEEVPALPVEEETPVADSLKPEIDEENVSSAIVESEITASEEKVVEETPLQEEPTAFTEDPQQEASLTEKENPLQEETTSPVDQDRLVTEEEKTVEVPSSEDEPHGEEEEKVQVEEETTQPDSSAQPLSPEPQPLVEEPQSPLDEFNTCKMNSNDICEVLSDVPEDS